MGSDENHIVVRAGDRVTLTGREIPDRWRGQDGTVTEITGELVTVSIIESFMPGGHPFELCVFRNEVTKNVG